MKIKSLFMVVSVSALAAGCASQQRIEEPAPAPEAVAPSAEQLAAADAIKAAKAALAKASANKWEWRDTRKRLKSAEAAFDAGDYPKAIQWANRARFEAQAAENQYYLERAKSILRNVDGHPGLNGDLAAQFNAANALVGEGRGRAAYDAARPLEAALAAAATADTRYTVVRGDNLWGISGKREIYGNPYQWPLIYKNNAEQIRDPDLIFPGQDFAIDLSPSGVDVDAAVRHAKTRGAWSVGGREASDADYLANH